MSQIYTFILSLILSTVAVSAMAASGASPSIYNGYIAPVAKEGAGDQSVQLLDGRYSKMKSMWLGLKEYNVYWSGLESSGVASSVNPLTCAAGYQMIPANAAEKASQGYHRYRCISSAALANLDNFFTRDAAAFLQTAVVLWSAPAIYRYPGCTGAPWNGGLLLDPCVPRDDVMDDYEDYVNVLAARYNGGIHGKISHFIVWNENASAGWFDYSPIVTNRGPVPAAQVQTWITKYATMMRRTYSAISRHTTSAMMYASTDLFWATPSTPPGQVSHIGTQTLVDGLWANLGTSIDWSLAVHPYGDPMVQVPTTIYNFNNLQSLVVTHQNQKLQALGISNPSAYPQSHLIASEQLPYDPNVVRDINQRALKICQAHNFAMQIPTLIGVDHNHFQQTDPTEIYGIVPVTVAQDLSNIDSSATGLAYESFNPAVWGQTNSNYCCQHANVGCSGTSPVPGAGQVMGTIDGVAANGNGTVNVYGWACAKNNPQSIPVDLYIGGPAGSGVMISRTTANFTSEPAVAAECGTYGSAFRYSVPMTAAQATQYQGQPVYIHGIDPFGLANSLLAHSGGVHLPGTLAPVIGNLDGFFPQSNGTGIISGWACAQGRSASISVDIYLGGPAGSGTSFGRFIANRYSEGAIASACHTTASAYRFAIPMTAAQMSQNNNRAIYAYGIDPAGITNVVLPGSGISTVFLPTINGVIDGITHNANGSSTLYGWACMMHETQSITVNVYANGPAGSGRLIGGYNANVASEPAIATACGSTGSHYRFSILFSASIDSQYRNQPIYVHGIDTYGQPNSLLSHSGSYVFPAP